MDMRPGLRLWSTISSTSLVVVRSPSREVRLTCGGAPLGGTEQPMRPEAPEGVTAALGKRYADADTGLEVLCTRAGSGALAVDGRLLQQLGARSLPASD